MEEANKDLRIRIRELETRETERVAEVEERERMAAKGQKTSCPVCKVAVFKLQRHLTSKKHGWTKTQYNTWALTNEVKQILPNKDCPIEGCIWKGRRLDMHLKSSRHKIKQGSELYERLVREERKKRKEEKRKERQVLKNVNREIGKCDIFIIYSSM